MSFDQLRRLVKARAERRGFKFRLDVEPWPYAGSLHRTGDTLVITLDSGRTRAEQLSALAHEVGHLVFGHYELSDEVWTMQDTASSEEHETEAEYFAMFALRTYGTPPERFLNEQIELQLRQWPGPE